MLMGIFLSVFVFTFYIMQEAGVYTVALRQVAKGEGAQGCEAELRIRAVHSTAPKIRFGGFCLSPPLRLRQKARTDLWVLLKKI